MARAGTRILKSARQALAYAQGCADTTEYGVHIPHEIDVKAIRQKVGMSQEVFAGHFGVSRRTLQDWEQGRRQPSGAARAFLVVIDREPQATRRALTGESLPTPTPTSSRAHR
jgi:putative transcriptional regulator